MSINYCTLASNSVDSFCSPRRGVIFNRLVQILHPPVINSAGGNPQHIRNTAAQILSRPQFDIDDRAPMVYEQPFVSVTVELFGSTGTQTMDVSSSNVDIVTVTGVEFGSPEPEIVINIQDFEIN